MTKPFPIARAIDPVALQWVHAFHGDSVALQPLSRHGCDASAVIAHDQALRDWKAELHEVISINATACALRAAHWYCADNENAEAPSLDVYAICDSTRPMRERIAAARLAGRDEKYATLSHVRDALAKLGGAISNRDDTSTLRLVCINSYITLISSEKWRLALEANDWKQGAHMLYNAATLSEQTAIKESSYAALGVLSDACPYPLEKIPFLQDLLPLVASNVVDLIDDTEDPSVRTLALGVFGMLYAGGFAECPDDLLSFLQKIVQWNEDRRVVLAAATLSTLVARNQSDPQ